MSIQMSMRLTPKQAGKLYQKSLAQEQRIKELEAAQQRVDKEAARKIATEFFYWRYNQPGANNQQGFDAWWEKVFNKQQSGDE